MGALGYHVDKAEDVGKVVKEAIQANKPSVINIQVDGTHLAPPFRKDALKMPTRLLDKYKHLDYETWEK